MTAKGKGECTFRAAYARAWEFVSFENYENQNGKIIKIPIRVPDGDPINVPDEDPIVVPPEDPIVVPEEDPIVVPPEVPIVVPDVILPEPDDEPSAPSDEDSEADLPESDVKPSTPSDEGSEASNNDEDDLTEIIKEVTDSDTGLGLPDQGDEASKTTDDDEET